MEGGLKICATPGSQKLGEAESTLVGSRGGRSLFKVQPKALHFGKQEMRCHEMIGDPACTVKLTWT